MKNLLLWWYFAKFLCLQALTANKTSVSELESKLEEEHRLRESAERERDREREKVKRLELEIDKRKEELQTTITENIGKVSLLMIS